MSREIELISDEQLQYLIFIGLSVGVAVLTGILYFRNNLFFKSYIGRINLLIEILFFILLGIILFYFSLSRGWFDIYKKENLKGGNNSVYS